MWMPITAQASPFEIGDTDAGKGFRIQSHVAHARSNEETSWAHPAVDFGWGLSDRLELNLSTGYGAIKPRGSERLHGGHDIQLALKWQLAAEDESRARPALAIEPALSLPMGGSAAGMSSGGVVLVLPLRASRQLGSSRVIGQLSYSRDYAAQASLLGYGVLYEYQLSPRLALGAELLGDAPLQQGMRHVHRGHVGIRWKPDQRWEIFGLLGRSLARSGHPPVSVFKLGAEYAFE